MPPPLNEIDQVAEIKLLGIIFPGNFNFEPHINYIMSISSQRIYFIKLLRDQGLCGEHLETIFHPLTVSRLSYALSARCGFTTTEQCERMNAFLKRSLKYGLTNKCFNINKILSNAKKTELYLKLYSNPIIVFIIYCHLVSVAWETLELVDTILNCYLRNNNT